MSRRTLWIALVAAAIVAVLSFAYPLYVIRPFRAQGAKELAAALVVLRIRPVLSILAVIVALAAATLLFKTSSRLRTRLGILQFVVLALVFGALSWVNIYEMMFHPAGAPAFVSAKDAALDPEEMVLTVNVNQVPRAYPVGYIAYHHVINDVVGGVPIVATY